MVGGPGWLIRVSENNSYFRDLKPLYSNTLPQPGSGLTFCILFLTYNPVRRIPPVLTILTFPPIPTVPYRAAHSQPLRTM